MRNSKIESGFKKAITIAKDGTAGYFEGVYNFDNPTIENEALANERKNTCVKCPIDAYVDEPIESLKIIDERIPELSNKMCDICACTLSYKLRQSKTICEKWLK